MAPFWGLYLRSLEFNAFQIGVLMSLLQVMRIFAPNIWGHIADHTGKRVAIVQIGRAGLPGRFRRRVLGQFVLGAVRGDVPDQLLLERVAAAGGSHHAVASGQQHRPLWPHPAVGFGRLHPGGGRAGRGAGSCLDQAGALGGAGLAGRHRADLAGHSRGGNRAPRTCPYPAARRAAPARSAGAVWRGFVDGGGARAVLHLLHDPSGRDRLQQVVRRLAVGVGRGVRDRHFSGHAARFSLGAPGNRAAGDAADRRRAFRVDRLAGRQPAGPAASRS